MASISSVLGGIGSSIAGAFKAFFDAVGRFFGSLFQAEVNIEANIHRLVDNFKAAKLDIEHEVEALRTFKFDAHWSSRVINVPIAIDAIRDLVDLVMNDWGERLDTLVAPIHELQLIFKAESFAGADPTQQVSGLTKTAVKVDEIATMIAQLADASDTALEIIELFTTVRETVEHLDVLFLQQGNPRKVVHDASATIRVGNLH